MLFTVYHIFLLISQPSFWLIAYLMSFVNFFNICQSPLKFSFPDMRIEKKWLKGVQPPKFNDIHEKKHSDEHLVDSTFEWNDKIDEIACVIFRLWNDFGIKSSLVWRWLWNEVEILHNFIYLDLVFSLKYWVNKMFIGVVFPLYSTLTITCDLRRSYHLRVFCCFCVSSLTEKRKISWEQ